MNDMSFRRECAVKHIFEVEQSEYKGEKDKNPYRTFQILTFILDEKSRERLMDEITFAADWFEHENVMGRDPRGEADFEAIRLVPLFYECYDALSDEAKFSMDRFFLQRDYSSIYGSENHALMYHVSRYLAAQFYLGSGKIFEQFGRKTPEEMYKWDENYIYEFLMFRAKKGWGEFDSFGYGAEIMLILGTLHRYTADKAMKKRTAMMMDVILLDMICDSYNGLYGGAHGRIYPDAALNTMGSGMFRLYCYYFGSRFNAPDGEGFNPSTVLFDYVPSDIVYKVERSRKYPYTNKEMKHLHSVSSWNREEINREHLMHLEHSYINKQTYVDERYMLGAVNHQDAYPRDVIEDMGYAHHQQHEWELTLPGGTNHKIFTHHPGDPGYHNIHNRFTGDHGCLCSTHYTNKNTAISIYTITKPDEYPYINGIVPLEIFDEKIFDGNYLFLSYPGLYISLYFSNGYRFNDFDEYKDIEILSDGRTHAVVLRVEYKEKYDCLEDFANEIKALLVDYDSDARTVEFDGIKVWYHGNSEKGEDNVYPYGKLYDCPYMQSVWNSAVIEITDGNDSVTYDFNNII